MLTHLHRRCCAELPEKALQKKIQGGRHESIAPSVLPIDSHQSGGLLKQDSHKRSEDATRPRDAETRAERPSQAVARRLLSAVVLGLTVVWFALGTAVGDSKDSDRPDPDSSEMKAAMERAREDGERERAKRNTPEARRRRAASRTAFQGQGRSESAAIARDHFEDFYGGPLWRGPRLLPGERLGRPVGENAAVLERPEGPDFLAVSTAPLHHDDASGERKPIDTSLVQRDGALEPRNAPSELRIATDARQGVSLGVGVRMRAAGTDEPSEALVRGDKAFFANVGPAADTDLTVAPVIGGAELAFQLRSPDAPEAPGIAFDLPAGAKLRVADGGKKPEDVPRDGAEVVKDGKTIMGVLPPLAVDADGQLLKSAYEISGDELRIRVPHRDQDVRYPILVDPYAYIQESFVGGGFGDQTYPWRTQETDPDFQHDLTPFGIGIKIALGGAQYPDGSYGDWYFPAPRRSHVVRADFISMWYRAYYSCAQIFIWGGWVQGTHHIWCHPGNTPELGGFSNHSVGICTAPDGSCATGGTNEGNQAYFRLSSTNPWGRFADATFSMGQSVISLWENHRPGVTGLSPGPPGGWFDPAHNGVSQNFRAHVHDEGLGNWKGSFRRPSRSSGTVTRDSTLGCGGQRGSFCPNDQWFPHDSDPGGNNFSYNFADLHEGVNSMGLMAVDIIGNHSAGDQANPSWDQYRWDIKIDPRYPTFTSYSGSLNQRTGWITDPNPSLTVNTNDPNPSGGQVSGMQWSRIEYNRPSGPSETKNNNKANGSGPPCDSQTGCQASLSHTYPWTSAPDGTHTVHVTAQDAVGHPISDSWTVKLDRALPTIVGNPSGSLYAPGSWMALGPKSVQVRATDATSGLERFELRVAPAGQTPQLVDSETPCGTCTNDHTATLDWNPAATSAEGTYDVQVLVFDKARPSGPATVRNWQVKLDKADPVHGAFSGSLNQRSGWINDPNPSLTVPVTDSGSGVKKNTIHIDPTGGPSNTQTNKKGDGTDCDAGSGCATSMSHTWAPPIGDGVHTVQVRAEDAVGKFDLESWTVKLDRARPTVDSVAGDLSQSNRWVRPGATYSMTADPSDSPSGVKTVQLKVNGAVVDQKPQNCTSGCPTNPPAQTLSWTVPTSGPDFNRSDADIEVVAIDDANNTSNRPAWKVRLDKAAPTAPVIVGTLKDAQDKSVSGDSFGLQVQAADGTVASPSSGVKSIMLLVEGQPRAPVEEQPCPPDNCTLSRSFTLNPGAGDQGKRRITVRVTDQVDNVANFEWDVIFDRKVPRLYGVTHTSLPSGWVETATPTVKLDARDPGDDVGPDEAGVKRIKLLTPKQGGGEDEQTWESTCTATVQNRCPRTATQTFGYGTNLPEGNNRVHAWTEDGSSPARRSTEEEWRVKIDRTPPDVQLSGTLKQFENLVLIGGSYDLQVDATDGNTAQPANERSGVKSIEVLVRKEEGQDPQFVRRFYDEQTQGDGSRPMSRSWVMRKEAFDEGLYTIRTVVKDHLGHPTTRDFQVRVGPAVLEPRAGMGLEDWWQFESVPTGAGTSAHVNLATGNMVWHSVPLSNPGRGLSTVANVTYNSTAVERDVQLDYNEIGEQFSMGIAGITRLNEPLDVSLAAINGPIFLTDPDGTRHKFQASQQGDWYIAPAGVQLFLRRFTPSLLPEGLTGEDAKKAWAATRPDGVTYYFDVQGYATYIQDRNENVIEFEYHDTPQTALCGFLPIGFPPPDPVCRKKVKRVVDPYGVDAKRNAAMPAEQKEQIVASRSVAVSYQETTLADQTLLRGRVTRLTDHAGRVTSFDYDNDGYLLKMTQALAGHGDPRQQESERIFNFEYEERNTADPTSLLARRYMTAVIDPQNDQNRGVKTRFEYEPRDIQQGLTAFERRKVLRVLDREGLARDFGYTRTEESGGRKYMNTSVVDPRRNGSSYKMDERARPVETVDPRGAKTRLVWDDHRTSDNNVDTLVRAADSPDSATTQMLYNFNGQLVERTDPNGHKTKLDYRLSEGTQEAGGGVDAGKQFVSDLIGLTTPRGLEANATCTCKWTFDVDTKGNVFKQTDPLGNEADTNFDAGRGQIAYEVNWHRPGQTGDKTTYEAYDPNGLPTVVKGPRVNAGEISASNRWLYRYDAVGNLIGVTDPRGAAAGADPSDQNGRNTTTLWYDRLDRLRIERIPKRSAQGQFVQRDTIYDVNDNVTARIDGNRKRTDFSYTQMDRLKEVQSPAAEHEPEVSTGGAAPPEREITKYEYDANQNVKVVHSPRGSGTAATDDHATRYAYDKSDNRIAEFRMREGGETPTSNDLITTYSYDLRGNQTGMIDPERNKAEARGYDDVTFQGARRFQYLYDGADNRTDVIEDPDGAAPIRTHYDYDANGNVVAVKGARGFQPGEDSDRYKTTYTYDAADRLTDTTDPEGGHTHRQLRPDGLVEVLTKPNGTAPGPAGDFETKYEYYADGKVKTITLPRAPDQYGPELKVRYPTRDAVGDPLVIQDARGNSFSNTFLDGGQLESTTRPSWWRESGGTFQESVPGERGGGGAGEGGEQKSDGGIDEQRTGATGEADVSPPGDLGSVDPMPMPELLPKSGATSFDYDDELRLKQVRWSGGIETLIDRDPMGRVTKVDRPFKPGVRIETTQRYDLNGNLRRSVDGSGNSTLYTYDAFGRQRDVIAPASSPTAGVTETTTRTYDQNDNVTEIRTPRGKTTQMQYDGVDRLIRSANPMGETTTFAYDAAGNQVAERSPRGNPLDCVVGATTNACPAFANPAPTCTNPTSSSPQCYEIRKTFDRANRVETIRDGLGNTTTYGYDENGNQTSVSSPGSRPASGAAIEPEVTTRRFDGRDLPWTETTGTGSARLTRVTEFDGNGNLRRQVNPKGVGSNGLPVHADSSTETGDASWNATLNVYREDNTLSASYLPWGDDKDGNEETARYRRDVDVDALGRTKEIGIPYDVNQRSSPEAVDRFTYYDNGWTKTSQDPTSKDDEGNTVEGDVITYDYEKTGHQKLWQVGPDTSSGRRMRRSYWPSGSLRTRVAELGDGSETKSYSYDYNADRMLTSVVDGEKNRTTTVGYDDAGRQTVIQTRDQDSASDRYFEKDVTFRYDRNGNVTERRTDGKGDLSSYAGGKTSRFVYDVLDRQIKTTVDRPNRRTHFYEVDYYPSGQRAVMRKKNRTASQEDSQATLRVTNSWFYRDDGRVTSKQRVAGGASESKTHAYEYNDNGDRTKDERGTYTFNPRSQVVVWKDKEPANNAAPTTTYTLDGSGNIVKKQEGTQTTTFDYFGDRLRTSNFTDSSSAFGSRADRYCYGRFGKLERVQNAACSATPDADDTRYDFDNFDRLVRSRVPGQQNQTYSYDGLDRRDQKCKGNDLSLPDPDANNLACTGGKRTEFSYIGTSESLSQETESPGAAQKVRSFDYDANGDRLGYDQPKTEEILGQDDGYRTYDKDANGSVIGLEGKTGAIPEKSKYSYDPYGELQSPNNGVTLPEAPPGIELDLAEAALDQDAQENPFRFQGFYYDSGVKTYDMQARAYRPKLGRFLTPDRFESASGNLNIQSDPLTQNRYAFVGGNPVNQIEWDGHEPASSFTNGCDAHYGSPWRCSRENWRLRRQAKKWRKRTPWLYSSNWRGRGNINGPQDAAQIAQYARDAVPGARGTAKAKTKGPVKRALGWIGRAGSNTGKAVAGVTEETGLAFRDMGVGLYEGAKQGFNCLKSGGTGIDPDCPGYPGSPNTMGEDPLKPLKDSWNYTFEGDTESDVGRSIALVASVAGVKVGPKGGGPKGTSPTVKELRDSKQKDAHHIIQDAAVRDVPGYRSGDAPGVVLEGPPYEVGSPHYAATQAQRSAGIGGTYGAERQVACLAMAAAGCSGRQIRDALRRADAYFIRQLGLNMGSPLRIPGDRRMR